MGRVRFEVPALVGSTWVLRAWRRSDAPALASAWSDPAIATHCGVPAEADLAAAEGWIDGWEARRAAGVALDLVVAAAPHRGDGVLGEVGLAPFRSGPGEPTAHDVVELGWWVGIEHRRRRLATEAVTAVAAWAAASLGAAHVVARIHPGHTASEAVAGHAGLALRGDLDDGHRLWSRPGSRAETAGTGATVHL